MKHGSGGFVSLSLLLAVVVATLIALQLATITAELRALELLMERIEARVDD
jgi:hypothetical protein